MQDKKLNLHNLDVLLEILENTPTENHATLQTVILQALKLPETIMPKILNKDFMHYLCSFSIMKYDQDFGFACSYYKEENRNDAVQIIHNNFGFIAETFYDILRKNWEDACDGYACDYEGYTAMHSPYDEEEEFEQVLDWDDFLDDLHCEDKIIENVIEHAQDYFDDNEIMDAIMNCITELRSYDYENPCEMLIAGFDDIIKQWGEN